MTDHQFHNEISIIKDMIDKTKRETANYGHLFVLPGFLLILMMIAIHLLHQFGMEQYVTTTLIVSVSIIGIVSAFIGFIITKRKTVKTYTSRIFGHIWMISGAVCLLTAIIFPLLKVYSIDLAPFVCWPVLGIALYLTGVIYEYTLIRVFSLAWFLGAVLIAVVPVPFGFYVTLLTIIMGYIIPGIVINKKYKSEVI